MSKVKLQKLLEQVFPQIPLKPASMMIVSVDGLKLAEIGILAEYVNSLPLHTEERRRPQVLTGAMFSLTDRISKEIHGRPFNDLFIESHQGVVYLKPVLDKVIIFVDWANDIELKDVMKQWEDIQENLEPLVEAFNRI